MAIATNNSDWLDKTVERIASKYGVKVTRRDSVESVVKRVNRQSKAGLPEKLDAESMVAYAGRVVRAMGAGDKYSQPKSGRMSEGGRKFGGVIKRDNRVKYENKLLGKMGAASKVRIIDPASLDLSKYLQSDEGK